MRQVTYPPESQQTEYDGYEAKLAELRSALAHAQELVDSLCRSGAPAPAKRHAPVLEEAYRRATFGNACVYLGRQEMSLLRLLLEAEDPLSTAEIMDGLYPTGSRPGEKIVAVYISHLRKKLRAVCGGKDPIQTIRGRGFKLHRDIIAQGAANDEPALAAGAVHQGYC
jgi:DNA-binding response OmpR family regulator